MSNNFSLSAQLSLNDDAFKQSLKSVKDNVKNLMDGVEGANGNIGEMSQALSKLKKISFAGKSVEEINSINTRIADLTDNIGDLKAKQSNASKSSDALTKGFKDATQASGGLIGNLKEAVSGFLPFNLMPSSLTKGVTGFKAMTKGVHGFKLALISTGIGALIVGLGLAVAALTNYFTNTEKGQIAFKKLTNNIAVYTQALMQTLNSLGEAVSLILQGKFKEGAKVAKEAIASLGEQIRKNKETVKELNADEEIYYKNKRDLIKNEARLDAEIAEAKLKVEQRDKYSAKEREGFAQEAINKQRELSKMKIDLAIQELRMEKAKSSMGDDSIEAKEKLAELEANVFNVKKDENDKLKEIITKQITLNEEVGKEEESAAKVLEYRTKSNELLASTPTLTTKKQSTVKTTFELENKGEKPEIKLAPVVDKTKTATFKNTLKSLQDDIDETAEKAMIVGDAVGGAFASMGNKIVDSLGLAEDGMGGFLSTMASTALNLIAMALSASIASAIEAGSLSGLATGAAAVVTTPVFIASLVGGVLSAFAAIPSFATGGIVPGSYYSGDNVPVMANSGEMILNGGQQQNLFKMLNAGNSNLMGNEVEFKIKGNELVGVLNKHSRKINYTR